MKSSESSSTSMMDKKRFSELVSPKSFKSEGHSEPRAQIRCFYCTKANFVSLEQLNIHISIMHNHRSHKDRKSEADKEHCVTSSFISCEFCLMKFSSMEKLVKHIKLIHDEKYREREKALKSTEPMSVDLKEGANKTYDDDDQPTDLSQRFSKKIKIESSSMPKSFNPPTKSPIASEVFLCNQCNASLP